MFPSKYCYFITCCNQDKMIISQLFLILFCCVSSGVTMSMEDVGSVIKQINRKVFLH